MNPGSRLFETLVPHGGYRIDRRKDALVPAWPDDDLDVIRPFEDSPCLHRVIADLQTDADSILGMANKWGVLTTAACKSGEPLDLWRETLRTLRNPTIPKLAEKLQSARFQLIPVEENGAVVVRYRATRFLDALYQRFAEELAGEISCAQCPAPGCGRWFLMSAGRGDRQFCSGACRMRVCRSGPR